MHQCFWPCRTWRSQISSVNSGVIGPNFTKFSHNIEASFMLLMHTLRYQYTIPYILEWQSNKWFCGKITYPLPNSLKISEKEGRLIICNSIPNIWCKDCENWSSRYWDSFADSKKKNKKNNEEEITEGKVLQRLPCNNMLMLKQYDKQWVGQDESWLMAQRWRYSDVNHATTRRMPQPGEHYEYVVLRI